MIKSNFINNPQKFGLFTSHFDPEECIDWFNCYRLGIEALDTGLWTPGEDGGEWTIIGHFINHEEK